MNDTIRFPHMYSRNVMWRISQTVYLSWRGTSWICQSGSYLYSLADIDPTKVETWDYRGLIETLPSSTPVTIDAKLSSRRIMSAACLLTSDPAIPIATPVGQRRHKHDDNIEEYYTKTSTMQVYRTTIQTKNIIRKQTKNDLKGRWSIIAT